MKKKSIEPVLKWVGGKRQLLHEITPHLPDDSPLYVEPFVGGGAVLLSQLPSRARINDSNTELINVYTVIRDNPQELLDLLKEHQERNSKDYFYEVRSIDRGLEYKSLSKVERAARIIYLNKTCYNGLYRVNSAGQLNVPYGNYKKPNIINREGIEKLSEYLQGDVEIMSGDFAEALDDIPAGGFVYFDPPYAPISPTSSFTGYTAGGFGEAEQLRLRDKCVELVEKGIHFMQSNSDSPAIRELYVDFQIKTVQARRSINSRGDKRNPISEVLIIG